MTKYEDNGQPHCSLSVCQISFPCLASVLLIVRSLYLVNSHQLSIVSFSLCKDICSFSALCFPFYMIHRTIEYDFNLFFNLIINSFTTLLPRTNYISRRFMLLLDLCIISWSLSLVILCVNAYYEQNLFFNHIFFNNYEHIRQQL